MREFYQQIRTFISGFVALHLHLKSNISTQSQPWAPTQAPHWLLDFTPRSSNNLLALTFTLTNLACYADTHSRDMSLTRTLLNVVNSHSNLLPKYLDRLSLSGGFLRTRSLCLCAYGLNFRQQQYEKNRLPTHAHTHQRFIYSYDPPTATHPYT